MALLIAAFNCGRDALKLQYRVEYREVQRNVRRDKREFAIVENAAYRDDFRNVYCISKELAYGRKSFDGPVKYVKGRLLIHDDEQLEKWKNISP